MTDKETIIDGVDVSECNYAILPKKQCPMKSMPYAKETNCIACKEHNTKRNFCKNNPNCYYKQLKRKEQKCEELKFNEKNFRIDAARAKMKASKYKQALDEIEEFCMVYSADHDTYEMVYKDILAFINKAKEQ